MRRGHSPADPLPRRGSGGSPPVGPGANQALHLGLRSPHGLVERVLLLPGRNHVVAGHLERERMILSKVEDRIAFLAGERIEAGTIDVDEVLGILWLEESQLDR